MSCHEWDMPVERGSETRRVRASERGVIITSKSTTQQVAALASCNGSSSGLLRHAQLRATRELLAVSTDQLWSSILIFGFEAAVEPSAERRVSRLDGSNACCLILEFHKGSSICDFDTNVTNWPAVLLCHPIVVVICDLPADHMVSVYVCPALFMPMSQQPFSAT